MTPDPGRPPTHRGPLADRVLLPQEGFSSPPSSLTSPSTPSSLGPSLTSTSGIGTSPSQRSLQSLLGEREPLARVPWATPHPGHPPLHPSPDSPPIPVTSLWGEVSLDGLHFLRSGRLCWPDRQKLGSFAEGSRQPRFRAGPGAPAGLPRVGRPGTVTSRGSVSLLPPAPRPQFQVPACSGHRPAPRQPHHQPQGAQPHDARRE